MKNKSRWDSLSMRDRATLINMYAKGGYTNIDDIRNHYNKFQDGGDSDIIASTLAKRNAFKEDLKSYYNDDPKKQRAAEVIIDNNLGIGFPSKYNYNATENLKSWYKKRNESFPELISNKQLEDVNYLLDNLGYTEASKILRRTTIPNIVPEELHDNYRDSFGKALRTGALYLKERPKTGGVYHDLAHVAIINDLPGSTTDASSENYVYDYPYNTLDEHEALHSIGDYFLDQVRNVMKKHGVSEDEYTNSVEELRSRLGQLRTVYDIDPSKKFTLEEIQEMRKGKDTSSKGLDIFNNPKYSDEFILDIFNNVASNDTVNNNYANYAKLGGKLNKFATGGYTEEENTVPTREEYITQRLEEARLKALEKSRTRTLPKSPLIPNEENEEEYNLKRKTFTENVARLEERLKSLEQQKSLGFLNADKQIQNTKANIKTYKDWLAKPYEKYKKGASCIYTATDNYGNDYLVSGNQSFAANPAKYGFKKIKRVDIQPGDLVQDVSLGYPNHAMIYNGKNESGLDTFNYSRGGDSEGDIVKGGTYKQNVPLDVFRFVGTAKDSTQYINDYNKVYGNKFQDGGKKDNLVEFKEFPTYSSWEENITANWPIAPKPTIDYEEIKRRQRWAESQDKPNAKSRAGAKGLFQIMPSTHKEYVAKTGKKGNIYDPKYNTEIRDWYMQDMLNSRTITNGNPTDSVQLAKQLAAYNWGRGNLGSFLEKQKKAGVDIYNTLDWINAMPKEPKNYVNFILKNKDTGGPRNNELYNSRPKIFLEY